MKVRNVAIAVFYDEDLNTLVQERGDHSRLGEKYGFFGGRIKEGETPKQAIERELLEEIGFVPEKLDYWLEDSYTWEKEGEYRGLADKVSCFSFTNHSQIGKKQSRRGQRHDKDELRKGACAEKGFPEGSTKFLRGLKAKLGKRS